jgi:hypothetical protein
VEVKILRLSQTDLFMENRKFFGLYVVIQTVAIVQNHLRVLKMLYKHGTVNTRDNLLEEKINEAE